MARVPKFPRFPTKPHASGQARIRINGKDYYLGGFDTQEARIEYARLATEFATSPDSPVFRKKSNPIVVAEIVAAWVSANCHDDKESREISRVATILCRLFGTTIAKDFDANSLEIVRDAMVSGSWMTNEEKADNTRRSKPIGWCVNQVNKSISRLKRIWKWADRKKLLPSGAFYHLCTLPPLRQNCGVRTTPRRLAADEASIDAAIADLPPMVAAMVQVQLLTGMRPSELVRMRAYQIELDIGDDLWAYRMTEHKTAHATGSDSVVVIGPEAQLVLFPWLEAAIRIGPNQPLWTPKPATCEHYSTDGYYRAIVRACERAGVKRFTPYQLRHLCKKRITREFGLDAARVILRQTSLCSTDGYDHHIDIESAKKIAQQAG